MPIADCLLYLPSSTCLPPLASLHTHPRLWKGRASTIGSYSYLSTHQQKCQLETLRYIYNTVLRMTSGIRPEYAEHLYILDTTSPAIPTPWLALREYWTLLSEVKRTRVAVKGSFELEKGGPTGALVSMWRSVVGHLKKIGVGRDTTSEQQSVFDLFQDEAEYEGLRAATVQKWVNEGTLGKASLMRM